MANTAENTATKGIQNMSTKKLVELFQATEHLNDVDIPTVRGWIMRELEKRDPDGFNKWLDQDAEDSTLHEYIRE